MDVDALLKPGIELSTMLGAATAIYGRGFNPVLSLKALTYFADVSRLSEDVKQRLSKAAVGVDLGKLPVFKPTRAPVTKDNGP